MATPREDYMTACKIHQEVKLLVPFEAAGIYLKIAPSTPKSVKLGFESAFHFTIFMKNAPKKVLKTVALENMDGLLEALKEVLASVK